jgi:hypothetical protein
VLGGKAASTTPYPKPPVAVFDLAAAVFLVFFSVRFLRRPRDPERAEQMAGQMSKIRHEAQCATLGSPVWAGRRRGAVCGH